MELSAAHKIKDQIRSGLPPGQTVHVIVDLAGYFD